MEKSGALNIKKSYMRCVAILNKLDWKIYLLVIAMIKLYIRTGMSIWMSDSTVDDLLYVNIAENLVKTGWFGAYNSLTLNKMPGYAFFLALCHILHIPYIFLLEALYILAVCVAVKAFEHIANTNIKKNIMLTFLIFSPVCFDSLISLRIYRLAIVPAFVLLVISTYAGLFFRTKESIKKRIGWAAGAGISTFLFWIIREDSIWLAPYIFGAGIIIVLSCIKMGRKKFFSNIGLVCTVYLIFFAGITGVKLINYSNYGVYTMTDYKDGSFSRATSAILRVAPETENEYIWVDQATLKKIIECSPTLAQMEEEIEIYCRLWDSLGVLGVDGEVEKDYITWALRQAASYAGFYADAHTAESFWGNVADEVEAALADGRLSERMGIQVSNLAKPIESSNVDEWLACTGESIVNVLNYSKCSLFLPANTVPDEYIRKAEWITNENIRYKDIIYGIKCEGWRFLTDEEAEFEIAFVTGNGERIVADIENVSRPDVGSYLESEGMSVAGVQELGFKVQCESENGLRTIEFYVNDNLEYTIDLKNQEEALWVRTDNMVGAVETFDKNSRMDVVDGSAFDAVGQRVIQVYRNASIFINILAVAGFILLLITTLKNRKEKEVSLLLVLLGMMGSYFALHLGVGLNYFAAHNRSGRYLYLAGAYPLQQLFIILTIFVLFEIIKETIRKVK